MCALLIIFEAHHVETVTNYIVYKNFRICLIPFSFSSEKEVHDTG